VLLAVALASFGADPPGVTRFHRIEVYNAMTTAVDGSVYFGPFVGTGIYKATSSGPVLSVATDARVTGLAAAPDGALWFVTADYVGRAMPGGAVTTVLPESGVWLFPAVASDGAFWYRPAAGPYVRRRDPGGSISQVSLPSGPYKLAPSTDGAVWAITSQAVFRISKTGVVQQFTLPDSPRDLAATSDGGVWVATSSNASGVFRLDVQGQVVESFPADLPEAMGIGPDGSVFLATRGYITRYLAGRLQLIRIDNETTCTGSSGAKSGYGWSFKRLAVASDGVLWLAQGLYDGATVDMIPPPCAPPPETWALVRLPEGTWAAIRGDLMGIPALSPALLAALAVAVCVIAFLRLR
jgi:streptogramin lyase